MAGYNFGAFKGVFTPSILTILGVVMYLRFGWVLGNVGLPLTLLIAALSCLITFFTGLAISALASNRKVGIGGAYNIISRSLGFEIGAAIGIPLLLAQTLGISFYIVGFSESVVSMWPTFDPVVIGLVTIVILTVIALVSANVAMRMQFFILMAIILSLVSFFMGGETAAPQVSEDFTPVGFWVAFAVFFPAVTGIEAGISMSGDLKDPGKDLSRGTLGAVVVGFLVYMAIPVFLSWRVESRAELVNNPLIMKDVARFGQAILIGIWGASISSALGAILGAPRTLQALAMDRVLPQVLGKPFGKTRDPRFAMAVTFLIACLGIVLGDLNMIAPLLAMFFLTSYGLLNFAAATEAAIGSPSWRPALRLHWSIHLLGAIGCFSVMAMINTVAAIVAIIFSISVYLLMKRRNLRAAWGDVRQGMAMGMIQRGIYEIARDKPDLKTWRPNVLVFVGSPKKRWPLVDIAHVVSQGQGFMTLATIVTTAKGEEAADGHARAVKETLEEYLDERKIRTLVKTYAAPDLSTGMQAVMSAYGYGPIEPNTIMIGGEGYQDSMDSFVDIVYRTHGLEKNLVMVCGHASDEEESEFALDGSVDIWWEKKSASSGLMLALAHTLQSDSSFADCDFKLKRIRLDGENKEDAEQHFKKLTALGRMDFAAEVVDSEDGKTRIEKIIDDSSDAVLAMAGVRPPQEGEEKAEYKRYLREVLDAAQKLPLVVLVIAGEDMPFENMFEGL